MRTATTVEASGFERWRVQRDFVVEAEKLGLDVCWVAEAWGSDAPSALGFYAACTEPPYRYSERELAAWFATPRTGKPGFGYIHSALDPGTAPEGEHLFVCGIACDLPEVSDRLRLAALMSDFEADMEQMYPALASSKWRVRHVITNFGLKARPGLVGGMRPHNVVPGVEGLVCGGDTFRSRSVGIDRAARSGLTCAELVLGRRVEGLEETWRY